ncbi:DUF3006 family protein [Rossellomorea vietnamensis]|uniref:DUF3006 family protein n=1 Tax=Rossellomorea vietnamensis TaxID=218284 RepID=UPI00077C8C86|nr:DUF3006 family protein [Rossellomorea vietnamensis]
MATKWYTLDRFEGEKAVLLLRSNEQEEKVVDKEKVMPSREGDILEVTLSKDEEIVSFKVLEKETEEAKKKANDLLRNLRNK